MFYKIKVYAYNENHLILFSCYFLSYFSRIMRSTDSRVMDRDCTTFRRQKLVTQWTGRGRSVHQSGNCWYINVCKCRTPGIFDVNCLCWLFSVQQSTGDCELPARSTLELHTKDERELDPGLDMRVFRVEVSLCLISSRNTLSI